MASRLRAQGGRVLLVLVLLASVSTVAFGGGYRASQVLLDDGAAWVVKGRTVAHVNGDTGRPDAEVARDLATGRERLEVVRTDGGVFVVNNGTGAVTRVDTATMTPGAERAGTPRTRFVAGGGRTYVLDPERRVAEEVDPATLARRASVEVPGGVDAGIVDAAGALWTLGSSGELSRVEGGQVVPLGRAGGEGAQLASVGGRPVVVDAGAGTATRWSAGGPEQAVVVLPLRGTRAEVAVPSEVGPVLYLAVEGSAELVAVDLDRREVRAQPLGLPPVADLGRPVVSQGRVAVPDLSGHRLLVVARDDLRVVQRAAVPTDAPSFQVAVQGDRFYATDPYRRTGVIVEADGRTRPLDKGEGSGVEEPRPAESTPPAAPEVPSPPVSSVLPDTAPPVVPVRPPPGGPPRPQGGPVADPPGRSDRPSEPSPEPEQVVVPDVVGDAVQTACARLEQLGLVCARRATGESGRGGSPDEVVESDPTGGTSVAPGSTVTVTHLGPVTVPDVSGDTVEQACERLRAAELACERAPDGQAAPEGEKAGIVLDQDPAAGSTAQSGDAVSLVHHDKVTVSDYAGRSPDEACGQITAVGLRCARKDLGSNAGTGAPTGSVTSQTPGRGSAATPGDGSSTGDVVEIGYYTSTDRAVGDYTSRSPGDACAAAQADGFACRAEVRRPYRRPDVTYAQSPAAGERAPAGAAVVVYYDDRTPTELQRWKQSGDEVWVITADPGRAADLTSRGYVNNTNRSDLGLAYPSSVGGELLIPITAWQCSCGGHDPNHYYTTGARPQPESAWGSQRGVAGHVFADNYVQGEMRQVVRMVRDAGTYEWTYATLGSGEHDFYVSRGFRNDAALGWTWNP